MATSAGARPLQYDQASIDAYVSTVKADLAKRGIHPLLEGPDVYVARTSEEADLLAALFRRDPILGIDTKLLPPHYVPWEHLSSSSAGNAGGDPPPPHSPDPSESPPPSDGDAYYAGAEPLPQIDVFTDEFAPERRTRPPPNPRQAFVDALPPDLVQYHLSRAPLDQPHRGLPTMANRRPVSLLQIASHHSCVLFQVRRILLQPPFRFPPQLRRLLANRRAAKYAVNASRLRLQLSHSYQVFPATALDIRSACEAAQVGSSNGAALDWEELRMLFRPGPNWTLRAPAHIHDYPQTDWDAPLLDATCARQAADEAFLRYLVAVKLASHGALPRGVSVNSLVTPPSAPDAPPSTVDPADTSAVAVDDREALAALARKCIHHKLADRAAAAASANPASPAPPSLFAFIPAVSARHVIHYMSSKYTPWRAAYGEGDRTKRLTALLLDLVRDGALVLYPSLTPGAPPVDPGVVSPKMVPAMYLAVAERRAAAAAAGLTLAVPPSLPVAPAEAAADAAAHGDLAMIPESEIWATAPFKAAFVRKVADALAAHVRSAHPDLVVDAPVAGSAAEFRATTSVAAVRNLLAHSPAVSGLPLSLRAREALVDHALRLLHLDGVVLADPLDPSRVAWARGDPTRITAQHVVDAGPCPDALLLRLFDAVTATSVVRTSRAVRRDALARVLVTGTRMLPWIRAACLGSDAAEAAGWNVDRDGAALLAEWVIDGWCDRHAATAFTDDLGTRFVHLHTPVPLRKPAPAVASPAETSTTLSALGGWHPDSMRVLAGLGIPRTPDTPLALPRVSADDLAVVASALRRERAHLDEFKLSALDHWLRFSFPVQSLPSLSSSSSQGAVTDRQVAAIIDACVAARVLVPTTGRARYVVNHAALLADPDAAAAMPVPKPYAFPDQATIQRLVLPALASPGRGEGMAPDTMRETIAAALAAAASPSSVRRRSSRAETDEVVEWVVWLLRRRGWIATESVVRVTRTGEKKAFVPAGGSAGESGARRRSGDTANPAKPAAKKAGEDWRNRRRK
ncbi:hypothetical protein H9P43_008629 [Blastocladiella emersonii ATCC 22665]|nr:hypothetical protein H9P43_008629 [Blastocladiella emersonii ATCC 22665]